MPQKTWAIGEEVLATDFNTYVQNQVVPRFASVAARDAAWPAVAAASGAVCVTTDLGRVWISDGATWNFAGYFKLAGRPGVILTDAAQTVATSTLADITWGTEGSDVDGWIPPGGAVLTVPAGLGGRYTMSFSGRWSASTAGSSATLIISGTAMYQASDNAVFNILGCNGSMLLAPGDTVKVSVIHAAGANRDVVSRLEIAWLGL